MRAGPPSTTPSGVRRRLLKAAGDRAEADAIALLSDAVHQGLTTAPRLVEVIAKLPRLPRRSMLGEVLTDVQAGTRSVLERRYLRDVERAHGLPLGERQVRHDAGSGTVHRDIRYGALTLRPGWAQVLEPCRLARLVTTILRLRGWTGQPRACHEHCAIHEHCAGGDSGGRGRT